MKKFAKFTIYSIILASLLTLSFYGGKHETEILRYIGMQNVVAQNIKENDTDASRFALLFEVLRFLKMHYVDEIKSDDYTKLAYGAVRGMLGSLDDQYTRFMDPKAYENMTIDTRGKFGGVGIVIGIEGGQLKVVAVLKGTPAEKAGLKARDLILKIDGASTEYMALDDAVARIRGDEGTTVVLTIWRRSFVEGKEFPIVRDIIKLDSVEEMKVLEDNIGYIHIDNFTERTAPVLKDYLLKLKAKKVKGLILDLRDNPGGLLDSAVDVANLFIDEGAIVHRKARNRELDTRYATKGNKVIDLPMAVLVNNSSASASEIVAGALQDNGIATLVGEKTFGKGLVQTIYQLSDNSAILVTTDKYYTAKMRDINKSGIMPDYEVKADPRTGHAVGVKMGDDENIKEGKPLEKGKSQVKKFPLDKIKEKLRKDEKLKNAGIVVFNGFPRDDVFYYNFNGASYLKLTDVGTLFGSKIDWDEKTKTIDIDTEEITEDEAEKEIRDAQLQKAIEVVKEKINAHKKSAVK
ncbi:MAG: S41 family peptidase [bacterium]